MLQPLHNMSEKEKDKKKKKKKIKVYAAEKKAGLEDKINNNSIKIQGKIV